MKESNKEIVKAERGRLPAKALFLQNNPEGVYDLDEFRRTFVELEDVTEFKAALALVGSWAEWERIKNNYSDFNTFISEWVAEVEAKLTSRALDRILQIASSRTDKNSFQAAKFIVTREYKKRAGAGRPTKAEKERELKQIVSVASETKDERERMLQVLQGGMK
jgi:hypothetical protein